MKEYEKFINYKFLFIIIIILFIYLNCKWGFYPVAVVLALSVSQYTGWLKNPAPQKFFFSLQLRYGNRSVSNYCKVEMLLICGKTHLSENVIGD
jgi:hypothetical protein